MTHPETFCLGTYCGRVIANDTIGECGGCPRGFRADDASICRPCSEELQLYDWIYLSFMVIIFFVIQCFFIDRSIKSNKFNYISFSLYLATICESIIASVLSILPFTSQHWDFRLKTCGVQAFSDWYTLFFNPSISEASAYCTQEAVYPLYSIVFVFYIVSLCLVLSRHIYFRLICFILYFITRSNYVKRNYPKDNVTRNTYYILYSIPALMFTHAIFGGIIYYVYPYMILIGSVISIAVHYSRHIDQSPIHLLQSTLHFRNFLIVFFHWLLHAFGIISLTELKRSTDFLFFLLIPFPTFFYILTAKFTDPAVL